MIGAICAAAITPFTAAHAYNVGDIVGQILSTDIVTYINDTPVVSYNIAGRTAIITQQLQPFGFEVSFDDASLTLSIKNGSPSPATATVYFPSFDTVGTPVGNVYYTDIVTDFDGDVLESFNIGGLTCVYADDFAAKCGSFVWNEADRTVRICKNGYQSAAISFTESSRTLTAAATAETLDDALARWGSPQKSNIIADADGGYTAVEAADYINIEKYDASFNLVNSYAIAYELPLFGALYCGEQYNYIVFGQENLQEDNSREVLRLVIYDKSFVKISEVSVSNCKTTVPFDASGCAISENDRYIIIHTSRSQYGDENGIRPQTQLTVIVDKQSWSVVNLLGKYQPNHTSHALNELAIFDDDKILTLDLSDTAPDRGAVLRALDFDGNVLGTKTVFSVGGSGGATCTGIMTGGFQKTSTGYLATVSALLPSLPIVYGNLHIEGIPYENRDVYAVWTENDTWALKHTLLAQYTYTGKTAGKAHLVPLEDGRFAALWAVYDNGAEGVSQYGDTVCFAVIDENGDTDGFVREIKAQLPSNGGVCVRGNKIVWYVNTDYARNFFSVEIPPRSAEVSSAPDAEENNSSQNTPLQDITEENTPEKTQEVDGI